MNKVKLSQHLCETIIKYPYPNGCSLTAKATLVLDSKKSMWCCGYLEIKSSVIKAEGKDSITIDHTWVEQNGIIKDAHKKYLALELGEDMNFSYKPLFKLPGKKYLKLSEDVQEESFDLLNRYITNQDLIKSFYTDTDLSKLHEFIYSMNNDIVQDYRDNRSLELETLA